MAALNAASSATQSVGTTQGQPPRPATGLVRPQSSQPPTPVFRPNWLQMQAAAHVPRPGQAEALRPASKPALQHSSWVEVKPEPAVKSSSIQPVLGMHQRTILPDIENMALVRCFMQPRSINQFHCILQPLTNKNMPS